MKKTTDIDSMYQRQVNWLRLRRISEPWPGKSETEHADSLYPNIAAEIIASNNSMHTVQTHARVTGEIIAAVIEDKEELTLQEMARLSRLWWCRIPYLYANTLQVVDPTTNKGKRRLRELTDTMKLLEGVDYFEKSHVESVCKALKSGKTITYAHYRWAVMEVQNGLRYLQEQEVRSVRMVRGRQRKTVN